VQSDVLGATIDGQHILGAETPGGGGITLNDLAVTIPSIKNNGVLTPIECPVTTNATTGAQTLGPLTIASTYTQSSITGVTASAVDQVVTGSVPQVTASQTVASPLAFVTYNGSTPGAALPYYIPAAAGVAGTVKYVTLSDCPSTSSGFPCNATILAPLVGAFSPDDSLFFVSTAGDNEIHYISIPPTVNAATPPTDTQQISPALPACLPVAEGGVDAGCTNPNPAATIVPATAIAVKPRSVT
jgi:trimeric autotransporter adhesin